MTPDLYANRTRNTKKLKPMKRKPYFPEQTGLWAGWFDNLATQLPLANAELDMDAAVVTARVADARYCQYACGPWLTFARETGTQATAALEVLLYQTSAAAYAMPVFTPPALPAGVVAVPAGALNRIKDFVAQIKRSPNYTDAIGQQLKIIGEEDTEEHAYPEFSLTQEREEGCQCVRIRFFKYGHKGVMIHSRRGAGAWESLGIDLASPYQDERPLLVAGQPEMREYRLQFYDNEGPNGEMSPIQQITVAP